MKLHFKPNWAIYLGVLWLAFLPQMVLAQQNTMNSDSLFREAQKLAFNKKLVGARNLCRYILQAKPDYFDARVLMANTYAWQHNYDSALINLQKVFSVKPKYYDALQSASDVYFWSGNLLQALNVTRQGLDDYPNDELFLFKLSKILLKIGKSDEAQRSLSHLLDLHPNYPGAKTLLSQIKNVRIFNRMTLGYAFEYFSKPYPFRWHLFNVDYQRKTAVGKLIASVRMADIVYNGETLLGTDKAFQYNLDFYPRLGKNNYAYLSYAYSAKGLFPKQRAGLEVFQKLPAAFEMSAGLRMMQFRSGVETTSKTWIYTGSLGKYLKNYWFSFRPYLTPKTSGISQSYFLILRRYFETADNYLGMSIGTGNSPDVITDYNNLLEIYQLKTKSVQIDFQHLVANKWLVRYAAGYKQVEYQPGSLRNVFYGTLQLSLYF